MRNDYADYILYYDGSHSSDHRYDAAALVNGLTIFDRMNALGVIGADTILLLVLFGYIDKRPDMYVDIAISYAILGFIGSLIVAKFIGGKRI